MSLHLRPYPSYRDSGLPWLGQIPEHWQFKRAKYLYREVDERSTTGDEELLSVSHLTGVTPRGEKNVTMFLAESNVGHKLSRPGDLVINTMWAWMAALGVARQVGLVSPSYGVYRPLSREILPGYADRLLRTSIYAAEYTRRSTGVNSSRLRLYPDEFLSIPILVPPEHEQRAIVRFVRHTEQLVARYIRGQRRLINLLRERNRIVLYENLLRGIDSDGSSSSEGVQDLPSDWKTVRLGRLIELITGFPFESAGFSESSDDIRLLRGINVAPGQVRWDDVVYWPIGERPSFEYYELHTGDIVVGLDRPVIHSGTRVAVLTDSDVPALLLQRVARIRPTDTVLRDFLLLVLESRRFADYLTAIFTGISVPHLSPTQIKNFQLTIPPINEQREIVARAETEKNLGKLATTSLAEVIALLREYRTNLVTNVVTGQLDVREAAASLPDEPDEVDELSLADEILEEADEADLEMEDLAEEVAE